MCVHTRTITFCFIPISKWITFNWTFARGLLFVCVLRCSWFVNVCRLLFIYFHLHIYESNSWYVDLFSHCLSFYLGQPRKMPCATRTVTMEKMEKIATNLTWILGIMKQLQTIVSICNKPFALAVLGCSPIKFRHNNASRWKQCSNAQCDRI